MLRNYVRTRQPNFVMPPNPTQASADRKICALPRRNAPSLPPPQFPVVHPQCNSFVSYGPATTMLLMQLLPDTNRPFSATKRVARPYLRCNRHRPPSGGIRHDEIRQPLYLAPTPAIQHQFYTCVSYGPATTTLQIRHLPDTNHLAPDTKSVEMSNVLLSGPTTPTRPTFPPATTTKSANSVPSAQTAPVRLIRQLRPRYNHATNATPFRYEENRSSYEERRTPLSGLRPSPTQDFPPCHDEIRQPRPAPEISPLWNSLVQYEPATAVERMERRSDTNHSFTATNRVPLPICHGTVPHPNARPHPPRHRDLS